MSQIEIYGKRDLTYSAWHRRESTRRFIGIEQAQLLAMIDLDSCLYVEYDDSTKEPIALIETARDVNQEIKAATVTKKLAMRCVPVLPAYTVLYMLDSVQKNPADPNYFDIKSFRWRCIHPKETDWITYNPQQYAEMLLRLRRKSSAFLDANQPKGKLFD